MSNLGSRCGSHGPHRQKRSQGDCSQASDEPPLINVLKSLSKNGPKIMTQIINFLENNSTFIRNFCCHFTTTSIYTHQVVPFSKSSHTHTLIPISVDQRLKSSLITDNAQINLKHPGHRPRISPKLIPAQRLFFQNQRRLTKIMPYHYILIYSPPSFKECQTRVTDSGQTIIILLDIDRSSKAGSTNYQRKLGLA